MRSLTHRLALLGIAALACGTGLAFADDLSALTADTRKQALPMLPKLQGALQDAMKQGGPENAISVCRDTAPRLAREASQSTGWRVSRVSLKNRNPQMGAPDVWEARQLADLSVRAAQGEKPDTLENVAVVEEGGKRYFRFIKALPVAEPCLGCHGAAEKLSPAVQAKLSEHYPADRATGYSLGQIRGGLSVKRPI